MRMHSTKNVSIDICNIFRHQFAHPPMHSAAKNAIFSFSTKLRPSVLLTAFNELQTEQSFRSKLFQHNLPRCADSLRHSSQKLHIFESSQKSSDSDFRMRQRLPNQRTFQLRRFQHNLPHHADSRRHSTKQTPIFNSSKNFV